MPEVPPYWHEINTPDPPPDLADALPAHAEHVLTISFLFELPYDIRVEDALFLTSANAEPWEGWTPAAMGALAGMPRLPDGVRPTHSLELRHARVWNGVPHQAVRQAFPDWDAHLEPPRQPISPDSPAANCEQESRGAVRVSIFQSAEELPGDDGEGIANWTSRRFDEALELTNQYLVMLAAMHDEWHISSLSRIDLPRELPYTLRLDPEMPGGPFPISGSLDIWSWFVDGIPPFRPPDEIQAVVAMVREYRSGRLPFFPWIELYQAAEHHLGSGRYAQSVIAATTGIEVLINTLFRVVAVLKDWDEQDLRKMLRANFK
jgi:hypothetical protein